jgi:hypothetical protein
MQSLPRELPRAYAALNELAELVLSPDSAGMSAKFKEKSLPESGQVKVHHAGGKG